MKDDSRLFYRTALISIDFFYVFNVHRTKKCFEIISSKEMFSMTFVAVKST